MSSITTILIFLILTSISLFFVSMINRRQLRTRLVKQKLGQMKRRSTELEELAAQLETLVENPKVSITINDETADLLKKMISLSPLNAYYAMSLEGVLQRAEELSIPGRKIELFRLMESDAAIARSQYALTEAAHIIRKRQAGGHIQVAEMDVMLRDLSWANFMIKISSNVGQGHKAVNRGDILRALAYYRKAIEVATEAGHKDDRQNQIIFELGEILNNKRKALSTNIMPETLYNPEEKSGSPGFFRHNINNDAKQA